MAEKRKTPKQKTQKQIIWLLLSGIFLIILFWLAAYFILTERINDLDLDKNLANESYQEHYAFIVNDYNDEFWVKVYEAAKKKGEESNIYVELFGADLQERYSVSQLFEMAMAAEVDGIIVNPNSTDCAEKIKQAKDRGIPVVTVLDDCKSDDQICFVGINRYNLGVEYGKQILKLDMGNSSGRIGKRVVILLEDNEQIESQKLIVAGIREKVKGYGFEIRTEKIRKKSMFHAEEDIQNIIFDKEKKPDIFICLTGDDTACTIQSLVEFNQVGLIQLIGYFDSEEAKEAIRKRIVDSVIGVDETQVGEQAVQAIINYTEKTEFSAIFDVDVYTVDYNDVREIRDGESN